MKKQNIFVLKRIAKAVFKKRLFLCGDRILIAISGGQDSITCFFFIFLIKKQFQLDINSSNCNHLFQTDSFYSSLNILNKVYALEGKYSLSLCPYWLSTEKEARNWRHSVLQRTACFNQFSSIYFGHTETDRLETLLFQLLRGSGLQGVHSIQWKKKRKRLRIETSVFFKKVSCFKARKALSENIFQDTKNKKAHFFVKKTSLSIIFSKQAKNDDFFLYYRPLLGITRFESFVICNGWNIPSYSDNSNHSICYTRNKVRNQVLPILRKILNPRLEKTVCRFAEIISEENFYLNSILHRIENSVFRSEKKFTRFSSFYETSSQSSLFSFPTKLKQAWKPPSSLVLTFYNQVEISLTAKSVKTASYTFPQLAGGTCCEASNLIAITTRITQKGVTTTFPKKMNKAFLKSNFRKNSIQFFVKKFSSFGLMFDSLAFLRQAPLTLKRRFLKKLLEDFQMRKVNFQRVEILTNSLFNKRNRLFNQDFSETLWVECPLNCLLGFSVFFLSNQRNKRNERLLLLRQKNNNFFSLIREKKNRKKMKTFFSVVFIPGVGVFLFLLKKEQN
jgi:tRNA(Ile)-lysidine synthase TilS/MesJ